MRSIIELIDALDVRKRILIIGSAFVDVIVHVPRLPLSGEDVEGSSRQQVVGGCAYNAADAVAKLGIDFDALIPVGEGMIADRVRETFRARGFTVREFRGIGDNGWCLSFVEPDGERTFVSMSGVEKCFKPEWLDEIDLQCVDLIYLSGYQADARNAGFIEALLAEKRPNAQILFDPGPCSGSIPEEMFSAILSANTILKVNAQEAKTLAPSATPREAAAVLSLLTAQSVIVTDGARGAYAAQAGKVSHLQGFPVHVVDTIGSGDAHAGGVLAGLASGFTLAEAVLLGNAVASWVTAQEGAANRRTASPAFARYLNVNPFRTFFSSTLGLKKNMSDASKIETNGVNPVPDNERYGRPFDLFPVWFSWNISIFGITLGIYVFGLGLSVWQAMLAGVIGYFLSCALVGILAVGSVRTGLPTLVQSRLAFGYHGNKLPTFFGYLANMGWKVTLLSMATTTLADLVANIVPGLLNDKGMPVAGCTLGCFAVVLLLTMSGAIYGHQLIIKIEKAIAWLTGIFTIVYLFFFIPNINFSALSSAPSGSFATFVGGIVLSMTMVGLGFLNYGDYARYLPRKTPARGVIFWTTTGIAVPVSVLLILGVMLAVGNPALLEKANHEPLAALTGILPFWFYVPFSLIVIISLISAGMTGIYSSGLALLALGVPMTRLATTILNGVIIALGAYYLLFISDSFVSTFQSFLALISVVMGTWGAIEMVDLLRQKRIGWDCKLALAPGEGGESVRWTAFGALIFASLIGLGTITSSDPYIAHAVSFLLPAGSETSVFARANIGLVAAMIIGASLYAVLTFVLQKGSHLKAE